MGHCFVPPTPVRVTLTLLATACDQAVPIPQLTAQSHTTAHSSPSTSTSTSYQGRRNLTLPPGPSPATDQNSAARRRICAQARSGGEVTCRRRDQSA
ncbi:hypothetical protein C2E23DRAFT_512267 [Lenzites betulinus]|nr:hypothetical protein C2E23DRAFT_512267 [Lenzites betulinus]